MSDSTREYFRSINLVVWQQLRGRSYNVLCSWLTKLSYLTVELKCLFLRQFAWIYNWRSSCRGWKEFSTTWKNVQGCSQILYNKTFPGFPKKTGNDDAQSRTVTMIRPSWVSTSCTLFKPLLLEVSTNLANSYNEETWVTLYTFLIKPKDWSGPNFVCPAIRKEYVIERWSFSKILYVRYQRKKLFLFWPVQLSA